MSAVSWSPPPSWRRLEFASPVLEFGPPVGGGAAEQPPVATHCPPSQEQHGASAMHLEYRSIVEHRIEGGGGVAQAVLTKSAPTIEAIAPEYASRNASVRQDSA